MGRPYLTFWWRKSPPFTVDDDIRFVTGHYRAGGPWTVRRIVYRIASRTGIVVRLGRNRPWHFIGIMSLTDRAERDEPTALRALNRDTHHETR